MKNGTQHTMKIRDLRLRVRLGCSAEERSRPQDVLVSADIRFHEAPAAEKTDDLRDTLCYARISETFRFHVAQREFHLIEKMAKDFHELLEKIAEGRADFSVTVHKVTPPVEDLTGGVEYTIGSF